MNNLPENNSDFLLYTSLDGEVRIDVFLNEEKEMRELNRLVELYLNFAELQAERNIPMKMAEWIEVWDAFLKITSYELLENSGKISHEQVIAKAIKEFEKFRMIQDRQFISDFDREVKNKEEIKKLLDIAYVINICQIHKEKMSFFSLNFAA